MTQKPLKMLKILILFQKNINWQTLIMTRKKYKFFINLGIDENWHVTYIFIHHIKKITKKRDSVYKNIIF